MLEARNVTKRLGTFQLKDISFTLPDGYIMGLIGRNGAGKTTLLRILLGLYKTDVGEVLLDDRVYSEQEKSIKEDMGCVLQEQLFLEGMSLLDNANLYGKYYKSYDSALLKSHLERFGLQENMTYGKISKGQELKFQFAFALSHHPKYLILDEPTGNFDPKFREEFYRILIDFVANGAHSVILATHLTEELDRIADYVTYLDKGSQIYATDMESLRGMYRIVGGEAYKIRLLPKEAIVYMEENEHGARALIRHAKRIHYDKELLVEQITLEELMYFLTKGGEQR